MIEFAFALDCEIVVLMSNFTLLDCLIRGVGGLEVSVLAFVTRVRGFKPGRSLRIFRAKKSSERLPSEGK